MTKNSFFFAIINNKWIVIFGKYYI